MKQVNQHRLQMGGGEVVEDVLTKAIPALTYPADNMIFNFFFFFAIKIFIHQAVHDREKK